MSFTSDIKIIRLGSIGSEVATLIGRYQREGDQGIDLSKEEKGILHQALKLVDQMRQGYDGVIETRKFNINAESPRSYNYYLRVRQQLPELGPVNKPEDFEREINMFGEILTKLSDRRTLGRKGKVKLGDVQKFFSRLSEVALEELYVMDNEKRGLESI